MRLINDVFGLARVSEADPLPPDDRVVAGSVLALDQLYRERSPALERRLARQVGPQDAADMAQESFLRLVGAASQADVTIEEPAAYLNQIAGNLLRNRAKSALQRTLALHLPIEDVEPAGPDPVAALEARDLLNRIQSALMKLNPKTREIFLAHRVDGLSYNAIADARGLSVKGVEWHMSKAIALIDRKLRSR